MNVRMNECEEAYQRGYANAKAKFEPKKGTWIEIEDDVCYRQICSECKKRIKVCIEDCGGENNVYGQSKFCPNCGAKMEEYA